ncbi:MAG: hypothetical protein ABSE43_04725 [Steroidobacteraceae bacterium]|jgi:hypothetical protein
MNERTVDSIRAAAALRLADLATVALARNGACPIATSVTRYAVVQLNPLTPIDVGNLQLHLPTITEGENKGIARQQQARIWQTATEAEILAASPEAT